MAVFGIDTAALLAGAGAAANIGGSLVRGAGSYKGGQAQSRTDLFRAQADAYRAQVARNLATTKRAEAERVVQGGVVQSDLAGLRTQQNVGAAKAKQAASGIDVNTGSAVDVREGIRKAGRFNQLATLSNANLQGWGYRASAVSDEANATMLEAEGAMQTDAAQYAREAGAIGLAGGILNAATSLPINWGGFGGGSTADTTASTVYGSDRPAIPADVSGGTGLIGGGV